MLNAHIARTLKCVRDEGGAITGMADYVARQTGITRGTAQKHLQKLRRACLLDYSKTDGWRLTEAGDKWLADTRARIDQLHASRHVRRRVMAFLPSGKTVIYPSMEAVVRVFHLQSERQACYYLNSGEYLPNTQVTLDWAIEEVER